LTLFAEGQRRSGRCRCRSRSPARRGLQRFAFDLDGCRPARSRHGATLRLTAVAGDKAIEVGFRLD
jgi:hypothetical protein